MNLNDVAVPTSPICSAAAAVVSEFSSAALANHCHRSYLLAAALGELEGLTIDHESLYVAAILHDLGLEPAFDNVAMPFEYASAHAVSIFAAGAGWSARRRRLAADIVIDHMRDEVDRASRPEGYVLGAATGLDISGRDPDRWPRQFLAQVFDMYPRLDLAQRFSACFEDQALRKPTSAAAAAVQSGIVDRIASNTVGQDDPPDVAGDRS